MNTRKELIEEANELALEFKGNISSTKLQNMINSAKGEEVDDTEEVIYNPSPVSAVKTPEILRREQIRDAKEAAFKTRVVTLTNKDPKENAVVTSAYLGFENQHYELTKDVPLDIAVELEQCLIDIALSSTMVMHKPEIDKHGDKTGNSVAITVSKYVVNYKD